jgi:hypothetical protein
MRFLRNRFVAKFLAVLLLLLIVESTIHATVGYALTTGPHQPEYISYEQPGATDMVNLLTGDFTFSLPILDVPGPEGGFSVPLTYNAGIGPDQEASWVGLGWTMNVGAITRSMVQYPDDASGEVQSVRRVDFDGVRGWTSATLGVGQTGWNTMDGHYGSLSLLGIINYQYDKSGGNGGLVGINVGSNGLTFNPVQFASAVITVATWGAGSAAVTAANIAVSSAVSIGMGAVMSYVASSQTPNTPTDGHWTYSKKERQELLHKNYWIWLDQTRYEEMLGVLNFDKAQLHLFDPSVRPGGGPFAYAMTSTALKINGTDYPIYNFPKNGNRQGTASDVSYYIPANRTYRDATGPTVLANDNYSVKAPSISGSVTPYRLDISCVSMPREMSGSHLRLAMVTNNAYKVPFIYEGSNANKHFNHVGSATAVTSPSFYYGLSATPDSNEPSTNSSLTFNLNDVVFQNQIRSDLVATKKIPMANHVEWLSNEEIINSPTAFSSGFMDYFSGSDRSQFRQSFTFGPTKNLFSSTRDFTDGKIALSPADLSYFTIGQALPIQVTVYEPDYDWETDQGNKTTFPVTATVTDKSSSPPYIVVNTAPFGAINEKYCEFIMTVNGSKRLNSIGGYSITGINGMTYHFALPRYEYSNYTKVSKAINATTPSTTQYSTITRDEPFANTWLLTGVTGADFVDRGGPGNGPNGLIDENDWGHWVRFNYGKYSDDYEWSIPYTESSPTLDASRTSFTFSKGHRQTYYLNSIETRSHVALFIKDNRSDNMGKNAGTSPTNGRSLLLSEIALLTRKDYQNLFIPVSQGGFGLPTDSGLGGLTNCWKYADFFSASGAHPPQGNHIVQNSLKRIKFNYTYDLCPSSLNSQAPNGGKLTLARVSILGRNNAKTVPDYKFEYGNNRWYYADDWDGWGMSGGYDFHKASNSDAAGSAWSLTRITNPLGSTIEVGYERDTYSSISGEIVYDPPVYYSNASSVDYYYGSNSMTSLLVSNPGQFRVGDILKISGSAQYTCHGGSSSYFSNYSGEFTVQSVGTDKIGLGTNFRNISNCSSGPVTINSDYGNIERLVKSKKGGNVRVASMALKDGDKEYKTRYLYTESNGFSTGAVAREPDYIKSRDFSFYDLPGYPFTPVMYSKVTVLAGKLSTDADYHTKQVYEFQTPNQSMISYSNLSDPNYTLVTSKRFGTNYYYYYEGYYKAVRNEIADYTSSIGKLKSVLTYDNVSTSPISSSYLFYSPTINNRNPTTGAIENNHQGVYSEGTLVFDRLSESGIIYKDLIKMARTTVLKYPSELTRVVSSKDGFTSETENKVWDLTTGLVVEKTEKSPLGSRTKTVTKLAHTVPAYAEMGSKAINITNKNMLGHEAGTYTYLLDASGNPAGLLGASVQTWKSEWLNYRIFDGTSFVDGNEPESQAKPVWRKHQNYVFKGTYADLRADGSLSFDAAKEFNFAAGATNTGWQKTSEVTRYDHYSAALEGKDLNNIFSSSKKDINASQVYANASNATYHEFAYSGAEDWNRSNTSLASVYLGGEVAKRNGTPIYKSATGSETHTGQIAAQLSAGGKAFTYKPTSLTNNRVYRVSAWTNSLAGAIYYSLNNGPEQTILPVITMKAGDWYQINAEIPVGAFSSLEVGVKSTNGTVSFDDFRFQPRDGSLTANVYDPVTGAVTFVLDNQNMFTQYEYNDRGQLIKTYSESFKYGMKLVSESKTNYGRFNSNQ